ncbi:MAG TPA: hypothetical protein DCR37_10065 [Glaciecola sp.]|nr:hypothetical protein [Glaciecola sp.]
MLSTYATIALAVSLSSSIIISSFFSSDAAAQNVSIADAQLEPKTEPKTEPKIIMHTLTVNVEHESGKDITVHVGQAGEINEFVFTLEQAKDAKFIETQLADLEPAVLEAIKGALLRIHRSEVLVNSDRVDEVEVQWVNELCNDTNADCESIIQVTKSNHDKR